MATRCTISGCDRMIREENVEPRYWRLRHDIVRTYHNAHEQLMLDPFVTERRFDKLTVAEWEMILDFLKANGLIA